MAAAEHPTHFAVELVGDVVSREPSARPVSECGLAVGGIRLRADDDDPTPRDVSQGRAAALREVGRIDDEQIGREPIEGRDQGRTRADFGCYPAATLPLQDLACEAQHGWVLHHNEHSWLAVAHRAPLRSHSSTLGLGTGPLNPSPLLNGDVDCYGPSSA